MLIVISHSNPDPLYRQVTDQIKDAIARGLVPAEFRLPSIRDLARELNISSITVKRAYADLESEGYILTRPGLGSFVAAIDEDRLRAEKLAEIRDRIRGIILTARRHGIEADRLIALIKDELEREDG